MEFKSTAMRCAIKEGKTKARKFLMFGFFAENIFKIFAEIRRGVSHV